MPAVILSGQNTNKAVSSWLLKRALAGQEYGARTLWPTMDLSREKVKDESRDGSRKWMTIHRGTVVQILNSIFRQKEQQCTKVDSEADFWKGRHIYKCIAMSEVVKESWWMVKMCTTAGSQCCTEVKGRVGKPQQQLLTLNIFPVELIFSGGADRCPSGWTSHQCHSA